MPVAFQDRVMADVFYPRMNKFVFATAGHTFAAAGEFINAGMRTGDSALTRKVTGPMDYANRQIVDKIEVDASVKMLQTSIANIRDVYLLSKAPHQMYWEDVGGRYFGFNDNGGTFGTPTGSSLVGGEFIFTLGENERSLEYKVNTKMANTEWDFLVAGSTAAPTGGTGGATTALTALTYGRDNYVRSGIESVTISASGMAAAKIGWFNSAKLVLKSFAAVKDHRGRGFAAFLDVDFEIVMLQSAVADLNAISQGLEQNDATISIGTWNDEIFLINAGATGGVGELTAGDKKNEVKLVCKGRCVYNQAADEAGAPPPNIDWGITTPTTAQFNLVGTGA